MKLKDVKKYFKNAKEVKCLYNGDVIDITQNIETPIHKFNEKFWISISNHRGISVQLTDGKKFAEIISYKDTYTVSKDFILEAHKDACSTLKTKIENQFPELFPKVDLEVGKWYKGNVDFESLIYITDLENKGSYNKIKYYGFTFGKYSEINNIQNCYHEKSLVLATKEEIETALKNEWKKIAKKYDYSVKTLDGYELHECGFEIVYNFTKNKAYLNSSEYQCIFDNGKWAEIISEPIELSLDEIAEKFGVDVSLIKIKK